MRVRTDDRRKAILEAAKEVFRDVGFERASMASISAKVGGSKATLYGYFKSKEELFAAAMIDALEEQGQEILDLLDTSQADVASVLSRFGRAYLGLVTSTEALAITRAALAESHTRKRLGAHLYELGPQRGLEAITSYLEAIGKKGELGIDDPVVAAHHLKALLEAGIMEPSLFGASPAFSVEVAVAAAIASFLKAYRKTA